jgi:myo-inositol-1(or 4)-monophosphatase
VGEGGLLETAVLAARRASTVILDRFGRLGPEDVDLKQASDFVTRVDRESEQLIISTVRARYPEHAFLAEESATDSGGRSPRWIIDPLDGTTNYIHGYPMFAVSIALEEEGRVSLGVVLDPLRDELFTAEREKGARLNGRPIRVSGLHSLDRALLGTGFPFRQKERLGQYLEAFKRLFVCTSGIRRAGSAALDLAHVAAGRLDGFFELGLSPWDVAAGSLLIEEAGGLVSDFGGGDAYLETGNIVAAVPALHGEVLAQVREVFKGDLDQ